MGSAAHLLDDIRHGWIAGLGAALAAIAVLATIFMVRDRRPADGLPVPEFVRQMASVDFPADGQVHVQARGALRITPTTALCTFRPGWGLDWQQVIAAFPGMTQQNRNAQAGVGDECLHGQPVFVLARPENNRLGSPYKVILAVWQGEAACVGVIERTDGVRPGVPVRPTDAVFSFHRIEDKQQRQDSIDGDMADLSRACLARFSGRN